VKIKETKKEKGKIEIEFFNKEDLNRILELLAQKN
ncbi:chromosome partitioning protein ParB, partial [Klebsiella pneumoniae]|nr:chromosome partitioning protein ParB [Klebsiella pneumoniae]